MKNFLIFILNKSIYKGESKKTNATSKFTGSNGASRRSVREMRSESKQITLLPRIVFGSQTKINNNENLVERKLSCLSKINERISTPMGQRTSKDLISLYDTEHNSKSHIDESVIFKRLKG